VGPLDFSLGVLYGVLEPTQILEACHVFGVNSQSSGCIVQYGFGLSENPSAALLLENSLEP